MKEKLEQEAREGLGTCTTGAATQTPCPRPAVTLWRDHIPVCREHALYARESELADDYRVALELIDDMTYTARGHGCDSLVLALDRVDAGMQQRLEDKEGEIEMLRRLADQHKSPLGDPLGDPLAEQERR